MAYVRLLNVYISDKEVKGRKFVGASVDVKDGDFYNVKVVDKFGEFPTTRGYHQVYVDTKDIWLDTRDGARVIRVRNPLFVKQHEIYELDYNQLDIIPTSTELVKVKVSKADAFVDELPNEDVSPLPVNNEDTPF